MSIINDDGILLSIAKYNDKCSRIIIFSENNGILQTFLKKNKKSIQCQVYDFLNFQCDYMGSYSYRSLEVCIVESYMKNIYNNRLLISIFNSSVAIVNSILKERGDLKNLYRIFKNMLFLTNYNCKNPLPYYMDFLSNVVGFLGININVNKCYVSGVDTDICYISPKTGNCVSRAIGEKYRQNLFEIPKSFHEYSEDKQDITNSINMLHYFLCKIFVENDRTKEITTIETFRKILMEEIRKADLS
ncbi:hypothetical protein FACS1894152_4270 [Bacilli bacterium]|nr:hypothetical protein FACS1894152_4270 [Bacilli bacterium]